MQIINNTIKLYTSNPRKIDYIFKRAYNENLDVKCVGSGVGDRGTAYILVLGTDDLSRVINDFNKKQEIKDKREEA